MFTIKIIRSGSINNSDIGPEQLTYQLDIQTKVVFSRIEKC